MSELLANVIRGDIVESKHRGAIVVVNNEGKILYHRGYPHVNTFIRSAAKPMQAMNVILSGAHKYYNLNKKEIAIMCASHFGEKIHRNVIKNLLEKIGLNKKDLKCGITTSRKKELAIKMAYKGVEKSQLLSDCSGKHCGFLAVCKMLNYDISNYLDKNHPVQKKIIKLISKITKTKLKKISVGIDGCSAPVFALPLYNMALGYARLASSSFDGKEMKKASKLIYESMIKYPEMISGSSGFCTELIEKTDGDLIGKVGAEGIYCIGIKKKKIGIALKIEDGSFRAIPVIIFNMLKKLDLLEKNQLKKLGEYQEKDILNECNIKVGEISPAF